jgi:hypothetical protein
MLMCSFFDHQAGVYGGRLAILKIIAFAWAIINNPHVRIYTNRKQGGIPNALVGKPQGGI